MSLKSRIKRLEKKLKPHKPSSVVMFVNPNLGETLETKYQKYLDEGGDPKAKIRSFIYVSATDEKITNPSYVPR